MIHRRRLSMARPRFSCRNDPRRRKAGDNCSLLQLGRRPPRQHRHRRSLLLPPLRVTQQCPNTRSLRCSACFATYSPQSSRLMPTPICVAAHCPESSSKTRLASMLHRRGSIAWCSTSGRKQSCPPVQCSTGTTRAPVRHSTHRVC